jgi:hypothetical protein
MTYISGMDPYSMECWILERHESVMRTAEMRSRVLAAEPHRLRMSLWLAANLRKLADRLDGQTRFDGATQKHTASI